MKWILSLVLFLSSMVSAEESYSLLAQLEGEWVGKWDNEYGIEFQISESNKVYEIKYLVEENIGQPYTELRVQGKPLNKNSVMAGTLLFVVSLEAKDEVSVIGIFDPGTRIAKLERK